MFICNTDIKTCDNYAEYELSKGTSLYDSGKYD